MDTRELPVQEYPCSKAELVQRSQLLKIYLERDSAALAGRGITPLVIADLAAESAAFDALNPDSWWKDEITAAVAARNTKREEMMIQIEELRDICEQALGVIDYNSFSYDYLAESVDGEFIDRVETIVDRATQHQAALTPKGATPAMVAAVATARNEFNDLHDAVSVAESTRTHKASERIIAGNALWRTMKDLCRSAITYYRRRNPAAAADYKELLKRQKNTQPPSAPTNVIVNAQTLLAMWNVALRATSYIVQTQESGSPAWATEAQGITVTQYQLVGHAGVFNVRIIAHNAGGNSAPSAEVTVEPALSPPGNFNYVTGLFTWLLIAGVTHYEMEASYDNGASWNQIFDGDFTEGSYAWTPPAGMFRIRSKSGTLVSAWVTITVA